MNESHIESQIKIRRKNSRKFFGILRRLAKSDPLINKLNITVYKAVYKEDSIKEKNRFTISPSKFINRSQNLINHNSAKNTNVNIIEDLITEKENSSPIGTELIEYPDSSDFDDDNE